MNRNGFQAERAGWPLRGRERTDAQQDGACRPSSEPNDATSLRLATGRAREDTTAHGRDGAINSTRLPWLQRAANAVTPELGDAVVLAVAVAAVAVVVVLAATGAL
jgi:hypothetical protein